MSRQPGSAADKPCPIPQLIGPVEPSTPVTEDRTAARPRPIPPDLLRAASRRLQIMALLGAVLWLTGTATYHFVIRAMTGGDPRWRQPQLMDLVAALSILTSLLLYWYIRRTDRDPRFVLDLGLAYLVVGTFSVGMVWHIDAVPASWVVQPTITWVGAMILMFAAIVPTTPKKMLAVGLISASMQPIGMLIARSRGTWKFDSFGDVILMHYPDFMLAGVAALISGVVIRLGQQVAKARELGSYQLGELLGRGGMGEVYRATHRMLARPAAIKLIRPEAIGAENRETAALAIRRFRREAEVAASLQSPHTVAIYDFGVTDDGTFYIVMELLDGMTLEDLVRRHGPLPANRIIAILRQVCESLEEAHATGVVHRDIKPANIHLGRIGLRHDFVKVLDFGLVKSVSRDATDHSLETAAGLVPGTPAFMAPEMALGESYDGRADLYALGCVAYYLVTGQPVFTGDTPLNLIAKHLNVQPIPLSARAKVAVPPALEALVMACLAKRPGDRPRSAAELAQGLAAVEVEDAWTDAEATEWWQSRSRSPANPVLAAVP